MSFAASVATRNGTEGSNFHIWNTVIASIKKQAGYHCQWLHADSHQTLSSKVFQFLQYKACHCMRCRRWDGRRCTWKYRLFKAKSTRFMVVCKRRPTLMVIAAYLNLKWQYICTIPTLYAL
jgi:hypothetical protein